MTDMNLYDLILELARVNSGAIFLIKGYELCQELKVGTINSKVLLLLNIEKL